MSEGRVLVVDDEPAMLENYERMLAREGYEVTTLSDPLRFRDVLADVRPDVLITDLRMPGADGMTLLAAARADAPHLPVLIITAHASVQSAVSAVREGAFDYLAKPFTGDQLAVAVNRALQYGGLAAENEVLKAQVARAPEESGILGSSPPVLRLLENLGRVAPSDADVLITGESGTGKELVAQAIHNQSRRRKGPFVPVDCAAMPEGLLESELFGHEKGAFTGAVGQRDGLLMQADGGTVFLDELGDLGPSLQAKLLRVLEQRQVRRLGDARLNDIDIRVVAATNVDLSAAVAAGDFRQDLYFRLNVVHLSVPPLRDRKADLPLLLHAFLARNAAAGGVEVPRVSPEVWEALERYDWPGNVRELKNLAQRLVVLNTDGRITLGDLPEGMRYDVPRFGAGAVSSNSVAGESPVPYEEAQAEALLEFKEAYVRRLLDRYGGNVTHAARAAGVSRRTLHRWLAELPPARSGES